MLQSFTKRYTDESADDWFAFTFYCDLCNRPWKSVPIPFSREKQSGICHRIFGFRSSLWKTEHKDAFERANREAMFHFNRCVSCKKWVCDQDFSEDEGKCYKCCEKKE